MSRHKLVKNMDLDDEMDDYDGGEEYADDGAGEGMCSLSFLFLGGCCIGRIVFSCLRGFRTDFMRLQSSVKKTKVCRYPSSFPTYPATTPQDIRIEAYLMDGI